MPLAFLRLGQSRTYNWHYETEPEPYMNGRRLPIGRGKGLGGSSSINALICIRGHRRDYDRIAESGLPEYTYEPAWFGLLGPAGMPRPFVERVSQEMARLVNAPTLSERLAKLGLEPLYLDPAAFTQVLRADYEKIGRIVKLAGVTAE